MDKELQPQVRRSTPLRVDCPRCGAEVLWQPENRYRPFCSARCKGADFGAWANEEYRVAGPVRVEDEEEL